MGTDGEVVKPKPNVVVRDTSPPPPGLPKASYQEYQSGMQAIDNEDWLEAQYYFDLALSELVSEGEDSTVVVDTAGLRTMNVKILRALELVYPHMASLGKVDSGLGMLADLTPFEQIDDSIEDAPLDSTDLRELTKEQDTLDLKQFSVPVVLNERVLREIQMLSEGVPEFTRGSISRMTSFDSMIREQLRARNMPEDLIYLAFVESGFKTHAYSRAKASGLWQFIPATGRRYGLQVDMWVDERRNPALATAAALDYLNDLHTEFGDWLLAMAAYNCGEGRVRRLLRDAGDSATYWTLNLPRETMHYVPRILAAMVIGHHPSMYGFVPEPQVEILFDTVTVTECVPLQNIAEAIGVSVNTMRDLNIELNRWCTPPNQRSYTLRLPEGTRDRFLEAYEKMDKSKFARWTQHKIRSGENLGAIARSYGMSLNELREANGLKNNKIRAGQVLLIPMPSGALPPSRDHKTDVSDASGTKHSKTKGNTNAQYTVKSGDNLASIARRFGVSINDLKTWNSITDSKIGVGDVLLTSEPKADVRQEVEASTVKAGTGSYTVKSGDTYYNISQQLGVSMNDLMDVNNAESGKLSLGQILKLPAQVRAGTAESTATQKAKKPVSSAVVPSSSSKSVAVKAEVGKIHVVREGDNLASISRKYSIAIPDLQRWNKLDAKSKLKIGQQLKLTGGKAAPLGIFYNVRKGDTLWDIAKRNNVGVQQIMDWNSIPGGKIYPGLRLKVGE